MAGRARRAFSDLSDRFRDLLRNAREGTPEFLAKVARPKRLERFEGVTRPGQVLAFLFVGPIIVVALALIVALNQVMAGVFATGWSPDDPFTGPFGWLITALTLGAFILAAYTWFQFVRTAGFGFFTWGD